MPEKYNGIKHYDEMALSKTHKLSKQILAEIVSFPAFYKGMSSIIRRKTTSRVPHSLLFSEFMYPAFSTAETVGLSLF